MRVFQKKGLFKDITSILIAIFCIVLIVILIVNVYKQVMNNEYNNARKMLEYTEKKINALGDGVETSFGIQSPCKSTSTCNWVIAGWKKEDTKRPDKCYFENCLCFCNVDGKLTEENVAKYCQDSKTGVCRFFGDKEINVFTRPSTKGTFEDKIVSLKGAMIPLNLKKQGKMYFLVYNPPL